MSMVTTCPACHTTFRVTAEQLNARQGEVRCGHCQSVFNAFDSLAPEPASQPAEPRSQSTSPDTDNHQPAADLGATTLAIDNTVVAEEIEVSLPAGAEPATVMTEPPSRLDAEHSPDEALPAIEIEFEVDAPNTISEFEVAAMDAVTEAPQAELLHTGEPPPIELPPEVEVASLAPPPGEVPHAAAATAPRHAAHEDEEPLFTSTYIPNPVPERKRHTGWWLLANFSLLLLFALQQGYYWRSQIAVLYPETRPFLQQACDLLHCSIPLPRELGLLDIASSELQALPERPNIILLTLVLRNQADMQQALPVIELTFTDADDKALARRQLRPAQYLQDSGRKLGDGIAAHSEIPLKLYVDTGKLEPAGYRLLLL